MRAGAASTIADPRAASAGSSKGKGKGKGQSRHAFLATLSGNGLQKTSAGCGQGGENLGEGPNHLQFRVSQLWASSSVNLSLGPRGV
eukprot:946171-Pyramimonas_sp.AAC.1